MTEEKLSDLERECLSHLLSYLRGLTNAREFWYLVALEQEHFASREALQMMQHVGKQQEAPKPETFYCDTPDCPHPVLKPGFCAECEALHAAFDSEQQERYQSVTYYPESDITVAIGEETPFDPSHWPPEIVEQHKNCGPDCPVKRPASEVQP